MRPIPAASVLRLDPAHQPLWRDDTTIQFGVDRRAEVTLSEHWHEPLLRQLQQGIRSGSFDVVAHRLGAPRDEARRLLHTLDPAMHTAPLEPLRVRVDTLDPADEGARFWAMDVLAQAGFHPSDAGDGVIEIVLVRGAATSRAFADRLAADRPHMPVALDRGGATIGPLVIPGRTPCLACRDAHETAADPAWPLVHTQLIGDSGPGMGAIRVVMAAAATGGLLREPQAEGVVLRLSADGRRKRTRIDFAPTCLCRDHDPRRDHRRPERRAPRGNARVPGAPAPASGSTRARASAQRA